MTTLPVARSFCILVLAVIFGTACNPEGPNPYPPPEGQLRSTLVTAAGRGTSRGPAAAPLPRPVIQVSFAQRLGITLGEASKHGAAMGLVARSGAVVLTVQSGGAASRRRIKRGDVIVGLATSRVKKSGGCGPAGAPLKPGQKFHIVVKRGSRIFSFYMKF